MSRAGSRLRICIATTSFPRWPGDNRGTFVFEAARALARQGQAVRVVAMHSPGASRRETMDGVEVFRPPYLWPARLEVLQKDMGGLPEVWRKNRLARLAVGPFMLKHVAAITRHARACDIIHANWTLSAVAAWLGQPLHRRPFVTTVQGSDIYQAPRLPLVAGLTRRALNRGCRVLALSRSLAQATQALGVNAAQIEIVPNGVDTARFRPGSADREPMVCFVGSLIPRKGVAYLIRALAALAGVRLVIIGEGPQRAALGRLADELGVGSRVSFLGGLAPDDIAAWLRRARALVLPSVEEGLGVVLLEALASGTPCIGSAVGGIPDVITPAVGRLVPPASPEALAEALRALLADRAAWQALSENARRMALEQYDWDRIAGRLLDIYAEAAGGSRRVGP